MPVFIIECWNIILAWTFSVSLLYLSLIAVVSFVFCFHRGFRNSRSEVFCKKSVLKNFAKFIGKHLCRSLFFTKVAGLRSATLLKKRLWHTGVFLRIFAKMFKNSYFKEQRQWLLLKFLFNLFAEWSTCLERRYCTLFHRTCHLLELSNCSPVIYSTLKPVLIMECWNVILPWFFSVSFLYVNLSAVGKFCVFVPLSFVVIFLCFVNFFFRVSPHKILRALLFRFICFHLG